jgi:hypothetical protein
MRCVRDVCCRTENATLLCEEGFCSTKHIVDNGRASESWKAACFSPCKCIFMLLLKSDELKASIAISLRAAAAALFI